MAATIVGVDIGGYSARAVEVSGFASGKPVLVRQAEVPLPESSVRRGEVIEVATVATALRRLWATGGFSSKNIVLGMGGPRVFARELSVPYGGLSQIRESLPFLVQDQLPVPVAEVLLDFFPVSTEQTASGKQVSGLLVAAIEDAVNANVEAAVQAGLRPVHVDFVPFAISRALAPVRTAKGSELLVGVGANTTNVVVVRDGVPQFVRILPSGGDDITRAIAQRMEWAPERAEQAKRALGMNVAMTRPEDRPIIEIIYEVVGELLTAISNTLNYYIGTKGSVPVERVLLNGSGARLSGFAQSLSELLRVPVVQADPFASVTMPHKMRPTDSQDAFAIAFGLALGDHS
ncbi:MAG: type IV pilus assembly protein PilM [Pseudolysinimonas sp.]|uniref:type IV pilus assembly protein PilM n=1 Tax=Pseudolysinimonas sp. TaxID=2680009 RepID=UPI0032664F58